MLYVTTGLVLWLTKECNDKNKLLVVSIPTMSAKLSKDIEKVINNYNRFIELFIFIVVVRKVVLIYVHQNKNFIVKKKFIF